MKQSKDLSQQQLTIFYFYVCVTFLKGSFTAVLYSNQAIFLRVAPQGWYFTWE